MEISTIFEVALASVAVIGFTIFAVKRSDLTKVNVSHGLDKQTGQIAQDVTSRVSDAAEHVANKVGDILQPLGSGTGAVLHAIADKIGQKQVEFERLNTESISLAQEVARLQNRKINVTGMTSQIKLSLIEVAQQYHSLKHHPLETKEESWSTQESKTEYLGLYVADYQVKIGVDIEKLSFQLIPNENRILVHGLRRLEILGITDLKIDAPLTEIRKFTKKGTISGSKAEILENDSRVHEYSKKHNQQILEEIQHSQSIGHLEEPNARFALAFLQACLSSTGFIVQESMKLLDIPLSFGELCLEVNRQVERSIEAVNIKLLEIDHKNTHVKSSMLAIARGEDDSVSQTV